MDVFHHHLETVEASCLWDLYFCHESLSKVLKNDTVTGSKESKNMLDEMLFICSELLPIFSVLSKIDFFCCPEASHLFFVHLPNIIVFDWKDNKSVWVVFKQWFWKRLLRLSEVLSLVDRLLSWLPSWVWYL